MNVYFIDPTYVKPEGWEALFSFLKVKAACSFIPTKDLLKLCKRSRQHGDGCFTVSASSLNREVLKNYMVSSWEALNEVV